MKNKTIKFNCRGAAGKGCDKFVVYDFGDGDISVDIFRKKKYYGVVLNKKDVEKLIKFLTLKLN